MAALLVLLVSASPAANTATPADDLPEVMRWDEFKLEFGRRFDASDNATALEATRRRHFEDTLSFVRSHNAEADAGLHTFRCGINQYADLSPDEFSALLGNRPAEHHQRPPVAEELAHVDAGAIPAAVDWRTKNAVSPVKNQGQCGACWAFSVTGAVEGAYAIATGALRSLSE
jgi:cathepsin L